MTGKDDKAKPDPPSNPELIAKHKREYFASFDLSIFRERVERFWKLDLSDSSVDVAEEVGNVLRFGETVLFPFSWDEYLPGTDIWRVRAIEADKFKEGIEVADLWEAPPGYVRPGRLNPSDGALLYGCMADPVGAMAEARLNAGAGFILIRYRAVAPLVLRRIGITNLDLALTGRQQEAEIEMSKFVRDVVSIPSSHYGPQTYTFTHQVLRALYSLDGAWESGWKFESTLNDGLQNVAIEPIEAHRILEVKSVIAGRMHEVGETGVSAFYLAFSDGTERFGAKIGFLDFPQAAFATLEEYIAWTEDN